MILDFLSRVKDITDFDHPLEISPYATMMGFRLRRSADDLLTVMRYHSDLIGAPFPPSLHGGTVASLMEMAAIMQLIWHQNINYIPKTIDITVDYLRRGMPEDCFAQAHVFRQGRRFATLHVQTWQSNPEKPIATAMVHFSLAN